MAERPPWTSVHNSASRRHPPHHLLTKIRSNNTEHPGFHSASHVMQVRSIEKSSIEEHQIVKSAEEEHVPIIAIG